MPRGSGSAIKPTWRLPDACRPPTKERVMKVRPVAAVLALVVIAVVAVPGSMPAQESDEAVRSLTRAVEALKESQARIQKDLEEIKALLRGRPSAGSPDSPSVTFKLTDEPTK